MHKNISFLLNYHQKQLMTDPIRPFPLKALSIQIKHTTDFCDIIDIVDYIIINNNEDLLRSLLLELLSEKAEQL